MGGEDTTILVRGTYDGRDISLIYGLVTAGYDVRYAKGNFPDSDNVTDVFDEEDADALVTPLAPHGPAAIHNLRRTLAQYGKEDADILLTHVPPDAVTYYDSVATVFDEEQTTDDVVAYLDGQ